MGLIENVSKPRFSAKTHLTDSDEDATTPTVPFRCSAAEISKNK